jgi:methanogenic corrinoid protein MtbC1
MVKRSKHPFQGVGKSKMRNDISPKQMARAIGVSEASVKRWCDKGLIATCRTPGGHRRLPVNEVLQFVRREGYPLVRSEILGLPSVTGKKEVTWERLAMHLERALVGGDQESVEQLVMDAYVRGHSAIDICDHALAKVFNVIGERWYCGELVIFEERRACEIVIRALDQLRRALPTVSEKAPFAIGGAISHDHYQLPSRMVEIALGELGWRSEIMGGHIPLTDWVKAIEKREPRMVWLSLSHLTEEDSFLEEYGILYEAAERMGVLVALGGRALHSDIRQQMKYSVFCDTLSHLSTFIKALPNEGSASFPPHDNPTR